MTTYNEYREDLLDKVKAKQELGELEFRAKQGIYNIGGGVANTTLAKDPMQSVADTSDMNSQHKGQDSTPLTISDQILKSIDFNSNILPFCNVIFSKGTKRFVMDASAPEPAGLVKEGGLIPTTDSKFKPVEIGAFKLAQIRKVTREAIEDVNFDILGHITSLMGESFAKGIEKMLIAGSGTGDLNTDAEPQGLMSYSTDVTAIGGGANETQVSVSGGIKVEDLIKAYYKLPHECRENAVLLVHPTVTSELALQTDGDGRPLLNPMFEGEFDIFMGKRIIETPWLQALGTSENKVAMWVDIRKALAVNLRTDLSVKRLNELYAANDMTGFVGLLRMDSKIVYNSAISCVKDK